MKTTLSYIPLDTPIHRLNPLTKLVMVFSLWIIAFAMTNLVVMLFVIVVSLVLWRLARIPLSGLKAFLGFILIIGILMVIVQGFFYFETGTVLFSIFGLEFSAEGAIFGLTIAVKILAIASAIPILTMTTPISTLMAGLGELHIPYKPIFIFGTAMRLTTLVETSYNDIREAQQLRAHNIKEMGLLKKITKGYFPVFIPLLLSLLRETSSMDIAIESRAFGTPGKRTHVEDVQPKAKDYIIMILSVVFATGVIWLSVYMGWGAGLTGWGGPFGN